MTRRQRPRPITHLAVLLASCTDVEAGHDTTNDLQLVTCDRCSRRAAALILLGAGRG